MKKRRYKKISPNLEKEILAKSADGHSNRAIAEWLGKERGVTITHQAVGQMLRQTRVSRAEVTKVVVREQLSKTVTSDLDRLTREQDRVERITRRLYRKAIAALDGMEATAAAIRADGDPEAADRIESLVEGVTDLTDAALKATDRVAKLAQMKLHFAGADGDTDASTALEEAEKRVRSRIDSLAAEFQKERDAGQDRNDA